MTELRLPSTVLPPDFVPAVTALLGALTASAGGRVRDAYVTAIPSFVAALRSGLAAAGVPLLEHGPALVFVLDGVRVQVSPLDSWNEWWDGRTFILEGGSDDVWVEGSGDVAPLGLSPRQLEVYAVLRHDDLWLPAEAFSAAALVELPPA